MKRTVGFPRRVGHSLLGLCGFASAGQIPVDVDYQYHAAAPASPGPWSRTRVMGRRNGSRFPSAQEEWVVDPEPGAAGRSEAPVVAGQWASEPQLPPDPTAWRPRVFTVTGGTNPTHSVEGGFPTYVWQWVIIPQPKAEFLEFSVAFPWAGVVGVDVANAVHPRANGARGHGRAWDWWDCSCSGDGGSKVAPIAADKFR